MFSSVNRVWLPEYLTSNKNRATTNSRLALVVIVLIICTASVDAMRLRGTTGILEGRVSDKQTHEVVVGVNVVLVGTMHGGVTDSEGFFQINYVQAGEYGVRFSMIGYRSIIVKKVAIFPDIRNRLDLELEPSAVELEVVEIRVERPLIQKDLAATAYSIGDLKLEKLPVSAFVDVLALQPGTTLEGNVRGGRTTEVSYLIDGLPAQDLIGGGLGTNIPKSSIIGMTIYTGGFEAEYGNALSGVVNVITKTGTNTHSRSVRFERDSWLHNGLSTQHNNLSELELSASGPLVPVRLFYFGAGTATVQDTRWWQDFKNFFDGPMNQEYSGIGKIEYVATPAVRIGGQGIFSFHSWHDYEYSWRYNLSGLPEEAQHSYRLALVLSHRVSDYTFYTISLGRYYRNSHIGGNSPDDLTLRPYGYDFFLRYIISGQKNWWADTRQITYTLKSDITTQIEKDHLVKAGAELNYFDISSSVVKYEPQRSYFGKPIAGAPLLNYSNRYTYFPKSGSVYLQDKIQTERDGSRLSFGLRWDFLDPTASRPIIEFVPSKQNEYTQVVSGFTRARFKHQLSPRIALAAPAGPSSFFFLNYGYYFQFPLFDYLYSGINPVQLREGARNILVGDPDLKPERTVAWEIGIKHGFTEDIVGSVTYFGKKTINQLDAKTLVAFDSKFAGDYGFASYVNNAEAKATGLEFVVSKEHDENLSGSISYSLMFTEGVSEYVDQRINFAQWGFPLIPKTFPLSWDQRHTIKVDGDFKSVWDIRGNLNILYNSPRPYTYYPTRDGYTPLDSTKSFLPNNLRMKNVVFVNLKISKSFTFGETHPTTLTVYSDIRNLLNTRNVRWIDSNGRIGGELSDPEAYYDPRRTRIGMRYDF